MCFSDPDVVPLIDRATTKYEVTRPNGSDILWMAPISERRNLWNWLPAFPKLAVFANRLLSMHTTACASERNWSKWGLMFAKNRARLGIERASQIIFLSENHVFTEFSEAELLDLSLEDDA